MLQTFRASGINQNLKTSLLATSLDAGFDDEFGIALAFVFVVIADEIGVCAGFDPSAVDEDIRTTSRADNDVRFSASRWQIVDGLEMDFRKLCGNFIA